MPRPLELVVVYDADSCDCDECGATWRAVRVPAPSLPPGMRAISCQLHGHCYWVRPGGRDGSGRPVASMAINEFLEDQPLLTPQQRRQIQAAFQVALVESPLPTVLTDLDGRILGTNGLVEELLGA